MPRCRHCDVGKLEHAFGTIYQCESCGRYSYYEKPTISLREVYNMKELKHAKVSKVQL